MASLDYAEPQATIRDVAGALAVALSGSWSADRAPRIEELIGEITERLPATSGARIDLSDVTRLDTLGAYVLNRLKARQERDLSLIHIFCPMPSSCRSRRSSPSPR